MKHEEYIDLLTADALGALDAIERRELEAHLASCAECRAEADVWREVAATLAYAAPSVAPPAALRERLFEQIKTQPPISRAEAVTKTEADSENSALPKPTNVVALDAEREKRRGGVLVGKPLLLVGSLAASIAIAALAITLAMAWAQNKELQAQLARATGNTRQTEQDLRQTEQELAALRAERDLLAAPASRTVTLAGTEVAAAAQARLIYDQQTGRAVLVAANLPPVPAGKAYQLWFIADDKPLPGGLFTTDASGHAELRETIPPAGRRAQLFAITLEPQSGSPAPTSSIYLKGAVS